MEVRLEKPSLIETGKLAEFEVDSSRVRPITIERHDVVYSHSCVADQAVKVTILGAYTY